MEAVPPNDARAAADPPASPPKPRTAAATATATASNVVTASAPLATERSARSTMTRNTMAKNAAAASVSHIGRVGDRQN